FPLFPYTSLFRSFLVLIFNNFFWQFWGSGVGIFWSCFSTYFPPLKNFLHFLLLLILFLFSMGVFVVVMLLHVSSACQGRVRAAQVHFTLDTKKDDTCYNRSTTSA